MSLEHFKDILSTLAEKLSSVLKASLISVFIQALGHIFNVK